MARFFFLLLYYFKKGVTEYLGSLIDMTNFNQKSNLLFAKNIPATASVRAERRAIETTGESPVLTTPLSLLLFVLSFNTTSDVEDDTSVEAVGFVLSLLSGVIVPSSTNVNSSLS